MVEDLAPTDRSLFQAITIVRWLTWSFAAVRLAISREHLVHESASYALMALALVFTAVTTVLFRTDTRRLAMPLMMIVELLIAALLLIGDGYVYADSRPQSLPWAWPAAAIVTIGIVLGRRAAVFAAGFISIASFIGEGLNDGGSGFSGWGIDASSKAALYILVALISGYVAKRLREAESEIAEARAREEIALRLHDGVLQTLAVVQRRSTDPELASLARDQERDLRDYLAGTRSAQDGLATSLRAAAALYERRHAGRAEVIVAEDLVEPDPAMIEALAGAVGEALANAGKHSGAARVVIYAEPDDAEPDDEGVFVSVKDNGVGFDPDVVEEGIGLRDSIRARIESVDGRVEISSRPDRGTEVRLWVP